MYRGSLLRKESFDFENNHIGHSLKIDIQEILAQTRVLLVPSLWPETFGYVVPEAMLRGIPVLASDIGGLPEARAHSLLKYEGVIWLSSFCDCPQ